MIRGDLARRAEELLGARAAFAAVAVRLEVGGKLVCFSCEGCRSTYVERHADDVAGR